MIVTGYKFLTIEDFNASNELCNAYYGIPVNETDTTRDWLAYSISYNLNNSVDFYYCVCDETAILGAPTEFEVRDMIDMLK
jgi:hypothetical protein